MRAFPAGTWSASYRPLDSLASVASPVERADRAVPARAGEGVRRGVRRRRPGHPAQPVRGLPGERRAGAGQAARRATRAPSRSGSWTPSTSTASRRRRRSAGRGSSTCGSADAWIAAQVDGARRPARRTHPGAADDPRRLLRARTSPRRCTSATCAPPSSATRSSARWSTSATASIRQNHVGDWGTMFGMLIEHLLDVGEDSPDAQLMVTDPNAFYAAANAEFQSDPEFATRARSRVVKLQGGDADTLRHWHELVDLSKQYFNRIYDDPRRHPDRRGPGRRVDVQRRARRASATSSRRRASRRSATARCACSSTATPAARASRVPLIIRKSDGGYGYATTDLATIRRRVRDMQRRPDPLRHRRAAVPAPQHGLGHRPQGRLAHRRRRGRARADRQRARRGPQAPAHPLGQAAQADGPARRGGRHGACGRRRGPTRPRRGGPRGDRAAGRHRRDQVRRPRRRPRQRLRLRPRPDGLAHRQHRPLPPVRRGADPLHLPLRRSRPGAAPTAPS